MDIRARETVILASDFSGLVNWYRDVLGFAVVKMFEESYLFCNLETSTGIKIGIGSAEQMGIEPGNRANNTVVLQFEVDNVTPFLEHVGENQGVVTFGPSFNEKDNFWYGGFTDPEGNPIWVVDKDCP